MKDYFKIFGLFTLVFVPIYLSSCLSRNQQIKRDAHVDSVKADFIRGGGSFDSVHAAFYHNRDTIYFYKKGNLQGKTVTTTEEK